MFGLLISSFLVHLALIATASRYRLGTVTLPENKYDVKLLNNPTAKLSGETIQMYSKYGQPFSCKFPKLSMNDSETVNDVNMTTISKLLGHLDSRCLSLVDGWWTYEVCYRRNVTQFHVEERNPENRLSETLLGYFSSETNWDSTNQVYSETSYHSQNYTGGDVCDITFKPRVAEVRFICLPGKSAVLVDVSEVETCIYLIHIGVPSLCTYSQFKTREASAASAEILCLPLLTTEELADFQSSSPARRLIAHQQESPDNGYRRSDDRVRTLWYTHRLILSRRQHRNRLQVMKLARRFVDVLHVRVISQPSSRFSYVAVHHFFRKILQPGKSVPFDMYLWQYSLMRLSDGLLDLLTAVKIWNDHSSTYHPKLLRSLFDFVEVIQKDLKPLVQRSTGVSRVAHTPVYNILEAITLVKSIIKGILSVTDMGELKNLITGLEATKQLLDLKNNGVSYAIILPRNRLFKHSPLSAEAVKVLKAKLDFHLTTMKLKIYDSEKEMSYRRLEKQIEHSVADMLNDLQDRVLVVQQPSRSSPNPQLVNNPYLFPRKKRPLDQPAKTVEQTDTADSEGLPNSNDRASRDETAWASIIEKVFQKVFPGVSVFQAPTKPGSSETLYIYSSAEKGKEHKRSSRQEAAYRFTVKGRKTRKTGDSRQP